MNFIGSINRLTIILIAGLFATTAARAQLTGWLYKDAIKIQENSGVQKLNYQVLLTINTQALILPGKMLVSGDDIRFAKDCNGSVLYSYWIESGLNTTSTKIWVKIDTLAASGSRIIHLFYGNSAASVAADFNATFPNQKIVTSAEATTDTIWNFDWVEIAAGGIVTITPTNFADGIYGKLTINARKIKIVGTIEGSGLGFTGGVTTNGNGPGAGAAPAAVGGPGGGGAGHGGTGGSPRRCR